jgi:hypothetical protein
MYICQNLLTTNFNEKIKLHILLNICNNVNVHSIINGSTVLCCALASSQFRDLLYLDSRIPWTSHQPIARPLRTHTKDNTNTE